jgi:hypothetical protein
MSAALPPRTPGPGAGEHARDVPVSDSPGTSASAAEVDPLTVFDPARREPDLRAMTRIVLRPIGSPMPLGLFTVAIDSVLVSALQWGLLPRVDRRAVALIVFPAFVVQVIVGIFAFHGRDSIAATLMMSFATIWLVDALIFYANLPGAADALGIFFVVFAVFTRSCWPARSLSVPWPRCLRWPCRVPDRRHR